MFLGRVLVEDVVVEVNVSIVDVQGKIFLTT